MGTVSVLPSALTLVVLAEWQPDTCRPERIHAVLGFTDDGRRIYQPLVVPRTAGDVVRQLLGDLERPARPQQLRLDLDLGLPRPSASGLTWRVWALPSIPAFLRHLPPAGAVGELARRLEAGR